MSNNNNTNEFHGNAIIEERSELPTQSVKAGEKESPQDEEKYMVTPQKPIAREEISQSENNKEMKMFIEQNLNKDYEKLINITQNLKVNRDRKASFDSNKFYIYILKRIEMRR